ncbi:hypothetical protein E2C01_052132 [Portunus trituberculatus]|uniref:Uncharacterized protein n=1 Tax=Portunus trituberculatus TaxID=210409 RepID=A0A5B7GM74_PORTR|nr:hypothetical protein [Portunus trituberculatus]
MSGHGAGRCRAGRGGATARKDLGGLDLGPGDPSAGPVERDPVTSFGLLRAARNRISRFLCLSCGIVLGFCSSYSSPLRTSCLRKDTWPALRRIFSPPAGTWRMRLWLRDDERLRYDKRFKASWIKAK